MGQELEAELLIGDIHGERAAFLAESLLALTLLLLLLTLFGDIEVDKFRLDVVFVYFDQKVLRLDVPVRNTVFVQIGNSVRDLV